MKKRARLVTVIDGWNGDAELYCVEPSHCGFKHIIVSAVVAPYSGPETYIFGASPHGTVLNWKELDGSFRGACSISRALENAGYRLDSESDDR